MKVRRIGSLDCETLSLALSCVVWEVALIVLDVDEHFIPQSEPEVYHVRLDLLSQLAMGRTVSQDTLRWGYRQYGAEFGQMVTGHNPDIPIQQVGDTLDELRKRARGLSALWMNGTSFDSARLHSLGESFGYCTTVPDLWFYGCERDLRGFRHELELPEVPGEPRANVKHRARADAEWNLKVLQVFGQFLARDVKRKRKVVRRA